MSDFDTALERLVTDASFRAALAADPARALAGYRLSEDELELLTAQVDTGTGGERQVEQRTSKASLFGLLSPMGGGSGLHDALHGGGSGSTDVLSAGGHTPAAAAYGDYADAGGGQAGFGSVADQSGPVPASEPLGSEGFSGSSDSSGLGAVVGRFGLDDGSGSGGGPVDTGSGGTVYRSGNAGGIGSAFGAAAGGHDVPAGGGGHDVLDTRQPPAGYHTRVDANGDGRWDNFTAVDRGDQGVDLEVDRDGDGHAEFVGHDLDRDGLIDQADTDTNGDGQVDTRWVDDNGDGWLDRSVPIPAQDGVTSGLGQAGPDALDGSGPGTDLLADRADEHLGRHRAG